MSKKRWFMVMLLFLLTTCLLPSVNALDLYSVTYETNGGSPVIASPKYDYSLGSSSNIATGITESTASFFDAADMDGDNLVDFVVSYQNSHTLALVTNDGLGGTSTSTIDDTGSNYGNVFLVDFNVDGKMDILLFKDGGNSLYLYLNQGESVFNIITVVDSSGSVIVASSSLDVADIDSDGDMDIVVAGNFSNHTIWFENTNLTFTQTDILECPSNTLVKLFDADKDGDSDMVVYSSLSWDVELYLNDGLGNFSFAQDLYVLDTIMDILPMDVDGDGDLDLLFGSGYILFFEQTSPGVYAEPTTLYTKTSGTIYDMQPYDFDYDGDPDLLVSGQGSLILETTPGALFGTVHSSFVNYSNRGRVIDFNNDGEMEFAIMYQLVRNLTIFDLTYGSLIMEEPQSPTKQDYDFDGWYLDALLTLAVTFPYTLTDDVTMYAKWTPKSYSLTYHLNDGVNDPLNPASYTVEDTPVVLLEPTKEGFSFGGWFESSEFAGNSVSRISTGEELLRSYELFALWVPEVYTIEYVSDGIIVKQSDFHFGDDLSTFVLPDDPTKTGYTFTGWDSSLPETMPSHDITIQAAFSVNSYTITFDSNGGSVCHPITQFYSTDVSEPFAPAKLGYSFVGWVESLLDEEYYVFSTMEARNITLYARWMPIEYSISYHLDGGLNPSSNAKSYTIEEEYDLTAATKLGFTFLGFYDNAEMVGDPVWAIPLGSTGNIDLYAFYEVNHYLVIYYYYDGSIAESIEVAYGEDLSDFSPTFEMITLIGYEFAGYEQSLPSTMPAHNVEMHPVYIHTLYSFTLRSEHSTEDEVSSLYYGDTLLIPTWTGHLFGGFYEDAELTIPFVGTTMPNENLTLYGKWSLASYTLHLHFASGIVMDVYIPFGASLISLNTSLVEDGFTFVLKDSSNHVVDMTTFTMPSEELDLWVVYTDIVAPVVTGCEEGKTYTTKSGCLIEFNEGTAKLNDVTIPNRTLVNEIGTYTLVVTDSDGNQTTVHFTVEKPFPYVAIWLPSASALVGVGLFLTKSKWLLLFKK